MFFANLDTSEPLSSSLTNYLPFLRLTTVPHNSG